jgi:hypothetical protein
MKRRVYHQTYMQLYAYTTHYSLPYVQSPSNRLCACLCSSRITLTPLCSSNLSSPMLCECVGGLASGVSTTPPPLLRLMHPQLIQKVYTLCEVSCDTGSTLQFKLVLTTAVWLCGWSSQWRLPHEDLACLTEIVFHGHSGWPIKWSTVLSLAWLPPY